MTRQGAEEQQALWSLEGELSELLSRHHSTFWSTFRSLDGWPEEPDERFLNCVYETLAEFFATKPRTRGEGSWKNIEIARFSRMLEQRMAAKKQ